MTPAVLANSILNSPTKWKCLGNCGDENHKKGINISAQQLFVVNSWSDFSPLEQLSGNLGRICVLFVRLTFISIKL
jgi:hypothetical protein